MKVLLNRCVECGRFLPNDDPYGDGHMSREHPEEYARQMENYRQRMAAGQSR